MKKRIVLSLSLVLALAMMSLTAFAAAPKASVTPDKSSAKKGDTVVFEVELERVVGSLTANVEVSGLEIKDVEADYYNAGALILAYSGGRAATATFTCEVTGEAGEVASLRLTNVEAGEDTAAPTPVDAVYAGSVTIAEEAPTEPTTPEDPTEPSNPEDPTDPTKPEEPTKPADPTNPANPSNPNGGNNGSSNGSASGSNQNASKPGSSNLDKAPNTGDTTASVWPLVLIGCMGVAAAVVAGKKLAYRR